MHICPVSRTHEIFGTFQAYVSLVLPGPTPKLLTSVHPYKKSHVRETRNISIHSELWALPFRCGGGLEYLHHGPARQRR
jgi:hypothetical protein